jgi:protein-L-isoaspartate(D-aspartate) O-methyltransferase
MTTPIRKLVAAIMLMFLFGCRSNGAPDRDAAPDAERRAERHAMVEEQIAARGVHDPRVLAALRSVPRHRFVPASEQREAYADWPLPIGHGQTISQPYIVGYMSDLIDLDSDERVLEIGTGCGYQAAVLGKLAKEVYTIEIVPELAASAEARLRELGYANVHVRAGDGYRGWPEAAPFDAILVTAAPDHVPQPLVDQLAVGGKLVIPVGGDWGQEIAILTRTPDGIRESRTLPVRFVPMTGEALGKK